MNGLIAPARIRSSISAITSSVVATPTSARRGAERVHVPTSPSSSAWCGRAIRRPGCRGSPPRADRADLGDIVAERVAADDLRIARMRQVDCHHALDAPGPVGHHQYAVGELHRLGQVVRDEQRRLLQRLLDPQHRVAKQQSRLLVESGEGSSISRIRGSEASVRAIATRWRMPPDSSAGRRRSNPAARPARRNARRAPGVPSWRPRRSRAERRRSPPRCATEMSILPGTPSRSPDACRQLLAGDAHRPS